MRFLPSIPKQPFWAARDEVYFSLPLSWFSAISQGMPKRSRKVENHFYMKHFLGLSSNKSSPKGKESQYPEKLPIKICTSVLQLPIALGYAVSWLTNKFTENVNGVKVMMMILKTMSHHLLRACVNKHIFSLILKITLLGDSHNPHFTIKEIQKG